MYWSHFTSTGNIKSIPESEIQSVNVDVCYHPERAGLTIIIIIFLSCLFGVKLHRPAGWKYEILKLKMFQQAKFHGAVLTQNFLTFISGARLIPTRPVE